MSNLYICTINLIDINCILHYKNYVGSAYCTLKHNFTVYLLCNALCTYVRIAGNAHMISFYLLRVYKRPNRNSYGGRMNERGGQAT